MNNIFHLGIKQSSIVSWALIKIAGVHLGTCVIIGKLIHSLRQSLYLQAGWLCSLYKEINQWIDVSSTELEHCYPPPAVPSTHLDHGVPRCVFRGGELGCGGAVTETLLTWLGSRYRIGNGSDWSRVGSDPVSSATVVDPEETAEVEQRGIDQGL